MKPQVVTSYKLFGYKTLIPQIERRVCLFAHTPVCLKITSYSIKSDNLTFFIAGINQLID